MKLQYSFFLILLIVIQYSQAQGIENEGDTRTESMTLTKGIITIFDDFDVAVPKAATFRNANGDLKLRTLGTPGGILTLKRNGTLLLENDDFNKIIEFAVKDNGDLRINKGAGGMNLMTLNSEGYISIGDTIITGGKLNITHDSQPGIMMINDSADVWQIMVDANGNYAWTSSNMGGAYIDHNDMYKYKTTSDVRLKTEIDTYDVEVLDKILELRPTLYYGIHALDAKKKSLGFIAQEVEQLFPNLVTEKESYKSLAYDDFAILSIKAIQEQQVIIESLISKINKLEDLISELK